MPIDSKVDHNFYLHETDKRCTRLENCNPILGKCHASFLFYRQKSKADTQSVHAPKQYLCSWRTIGGIDSVSVDFEYFIPGNRGRLKIIGCYFLHASTTNHVLLISWQAAAAASSLRKKFASRIVRTNFWNKYIGTRHQSLATSPGRRIEKLNWIGKDLRILVEIPKFS